MLYSWKLFPNSAHSHWLLQGHMTSNNETVSRQNLCAGHIARSMTSEGKSALLPANVDRRPPLQRGLMNFQLQNFQLHKKLLKDWSLGASGNTEIRGKKNQLFPSEPVINRVSSSYFFLFFPIF